MKNGIEIVDADSVHILHNTFYCFNEFTTDYRALIYGPADNTVNFEMKNNIFYICNHEGYVYAWKSNSVQTNADVIIELIREIDDHLHKEDGYKNGEFLNFIKSLYRSGYNAT